MAKGLSFLFEPPVTRVRVRMDPKGLHLVLSNLLSNAVKYTAAGSVTLRVTQTGSSVEIRVSDTGIGIPEKDMPKLFGEFFRASNARKAGIEGSGRGTGERQMSRRTGLGGNIGLETREAAGTAFIVRLPAA